MTTKTVYQTTPFGLYVGPVEADQNPLEPGAFLIPGGCVEISPPPMQEHKAAYWDGKAWQILDYFEGVTVYSISTGEPLVLQGAQAMPSGYTLDRPGPNQVWKNGKWVDDIGAVLAALYQEKLIAIGADCGRYIQSGFNSSALGSSFRYSSETDDQLNLTGAILSGLDADYPCFNVDQEKAFRPHTAEQLHRVGQDLMRFKNAALQHADRLKQDLARALDNKQLKVMKAITWTLPA